MIFYGVRTRGCGILFCSVQIWFINFSFASIAKIKRQTTACRWQNFVFRIYWYKIIGRIAILRFVYTRLLVRRVAWTLSAPLRKHTNKKQLTLFNVEFMTWVCSVLNADATLIDNNFLIYLFVAFPANWLMDLTHLFRVLFCVRMDVRSGAIFSSSWFAFDACAQSDNIHKSVLFYSLGCEHLCSAWRISFEFLEKFICLPFFCSLIHMSNGNAKWNDFSLPIIKCIAPVRLI